MGALTADEQRLLLYVAGHVGEHMRGPTLRMIQRDLDIASIRVVSGRVSRLIDAGYLSRAEAPRDPLVLLVKNADE